MGSVGRSGRTLNFFEKNVKNERRKNRLAKGNKAQNPRVERNPTGKPCGEKRIRKARKGKNSPVAYFDYHAVARRLIRTGHFVKKEYVGVWNDISPALVLFFDNHIPMPIRKERWGEYEAILTECGY